jgi:hypothetical protein
MPSAYHNLFLQGSGNNGLQSMWQNPRNLRIVLLEFVFEDEKGDEEDSMINNP